MKLNGDLETILRQNEPKPNAEAGRQTGLGQVSPPRRRLASSLDRSLAVSIMDSIHSNRAKKRAKEGDVEATFCARPESRLTTDFVKISRNSAQKGDQNRKMISHGGRKSTDDYESSLAHVKRVFSPFGGSFDSAEEEVTGRCLPLAPVKVIRNFNKKHYSSLSTATDV